MHEFHKRPSLSLQSAVKGFLQTLLLFISVSWSPSGLSHTFFESIVNIDVSPKTGKLEIVHSYTLHDITAVLMQQTQLAINLEHPEHEFILKRYIEKNFKLRQGSKAVELQWVGILITPQTVEVYQESTEPLSLSTLELKQSVLRDSLARQINRVNFTEGASKGTLIFAGDSTWRKFQQTP